MGDINILLLSELDSFHLLWGEKISGRQQLVNKYVYAACVHWCIRLIVDWQVWNILQVILSLARIAVSI